MKKKFNLFLSLLLCVMLFGINNIEAKSYPIFQKQVEPYSFSVQTYEHIYEIEAEAEILGEVYSWNITLQVEGQFNYNDNTYEIVSYTEPRMTIVDADSIDPDLEFSILNPECNVWILNDEGCLEIIASCNFEVYGLIGIGFPIEVDTKTNRCSESFKIYL